MHNIYSDPSYPWPAPAKINLFLHVVGKRADGYHDLQTAFQFLNYGDDVFFDINHSGEITRNYDLGFPEQSDLCLLAARKLKQFVLDSAELNRAELNSSELNCSELNKKGVTIGLTKRLPMGGGLGGGSSNAATVLLVLNQLWKFGLNREQLAGIGLELGADVPVFIHGFAAWAEGIGEKLTPLNPPESWFVVLNPGVEVSTAKVFSNKHLTPMPQMKKIRALEKGISSETSEKLDSESVIDSTFGVNQLEAIVRTEYPEVNDLLEWLSQFGQPRMSGSGGSVFLPVRNEQLGYDILRKRPSNSAGFVAKGENFHPLLKKLK